MWNGNVKYKIDGEAVMMWMNLKYSTGCKGKLWGNPQSEKSISVLSVSLTDCHHSVKLHVGKRSEGEKEALWFLFL